MINPISREAALPIVGVRSSVRDMSSAISRMVTGLKILGGNDATSHAMGDALRAEGTSFSQASVNAETAISLLSTVETALLELSSLATRLKEIGIADDLSTNDTNDTAALNAEATSVSDTIDSIVSSLTFNSLNVLGTSAKTFSVGIDNQGNSSTIKTTTGITATNVSDATNADTTATATLGEITQSLGNVSGALTSLGAFSNISTSSAANLIAAADNLQSTNFALESARLVKANLLKNYSLTLTAQANSSEVSKLKLLA